MKITGQILKENREKSGISVAEVSIATKINTKTLMAMEDGDMNRLPPKTFLRGFVRAYASFLHLDVDHILNTFQEEMGSTKPKAVISTEESAKSGPSSASTPVDPAQLNDPKANLIKYSAIAGILILLILIVLIKKKMDNYESESHVPPAATTESTTTPNANVESPVREESDASAVTGKTNDTAPTPASPSPAPSATPTASPSPTSTPAANVVVVKPTASPTASPSPTAVPSPTPSPTPVQVPTVAPTPTSTPKPAVTPTPTPSAITSTTPLPSPAPTPSGKPQEVIIEALNTVEVDAQVDGMASKKVKLEPNQVHTLKAKRRVVLRFSDGGAVNLIVNGVDRGVPGDLGKPGRAEFQ